MSAPRRSRAWRLAAALAAAVAVAGIAAQPASSAFPGQNGKIAFQSFRDGNGEIYVMNANGSVQTRLTNNATSDSQPAWSPDGQKIAFSTSRIVDDNAEVYAMNPDGSAQTNLTNDEDFDGEPAWSPDGQKIAFSTSRDGDDNSEIFAMNANGSAQTNLTNNGPAFDSAPAWSPDGQKIAFQRVVSGGGGFEVFVMNANGSTQTNLTNNAVGDSSPAWSPDGQKIAFESNRDGNSEIYVMNANGSAPTNLTNNPAADSSPAWSPDGQKIAFTSSRDGPSKVFVMNANGSAQTSLTNTAGDFGPDWQPVPTAPPVIFVHGFLGSKIFCGDQEAWPDLPFPALENIALGPDGQTTPNCPSAGPKTGRLLETVAGTDVYKSTVDFLSSQFPSTFHLYAWDWRKSPEEAIGGLDALIDQVRPPGGKVVLMAHSMGGLVTRLYVGDPARAEKVSRVLTIGTPYFGSPKALFPFIYGVEAPGASGLDALIDNDALREFSRYMQGLFFLWPSASYGGWLSIEGRHPSPLNTAGLLNLIDDRGGNPSLLATALAAHAQRIDSFTSGGTDYQTIIGTGLHTIGAVRIERAPELVRTVQGPLGIDERDIVHLTWVNGDGTVPRSSAIGSTPGVRRHFTCGIPHVPLPGNVSVTTRVQDFLADGTEIPDGLGPSSLACDPQGFALSIFPLADGVFTDTSASLRAWGAHASVAKLSLGQADTAGLVESLNTGHQIEAATSTKDPLGLTLTTTKGAAIQISPMTNGRRGKAKTYLATGRGPLKIALADKVSVRLGHKKLKAHKPDNRAPKTRVRVSLRGPAATLRFKVKDASPSTTYVKAGKRTRRVKHGRFRLPAKKLHRGVHFLSIDAFGNAEKPKRIKR